MTIDPTQVSFSQAQGYEPLPQPLKLEELSSRARIQIWNAFHQTFIEPEEDEEIDVADVANLVFSLHVDFFEMPIDEEPSGIGQWEYLEGFKDYFFKRRFNEIFDVLTFLMRHDVCPDVFTTELIEVFENCQLAYVIEPGPSPTIYPASTLEEGRSTVQAIGELKEYGLDGARQHLIQSSAFINQGEWARSVHESISAVESVARRIAPGTNTLGAALNRLGHLGMLEHSSLRNGLEKLYEYTSDEQGVRHSLLDQGQSNVGQDEAVFMLGACASFASYLWRKHLATGSKGM